MLKIEKLAEEETTVLRLVGRITAQHLEELRELIAVHARSLVELRRA
jgi:hypothetical protein